MKHKVPKQFYHWLKRLGIKPVCKLRSIRKFYFKNNERYYRMYWDNQYFEVSEKFETFDRWANSSLGIYPTPQTFEELKSIVETVVD